MNLMQKLERKWGRYQIYGLHKYFVIAYMIGFFLDNISGGVINSYMAFSMPLILKGQIWRLVTWVLCNQSSGIFGLLFMLCLIPMGQTLEQFLGTFRMNVYLFGGVVLNVVGGIVIWLVSLPFISGGLPVHLSLYYILLTTFMALAICVPDARVNLYFLIPIKMKWLLIIYYLELLYELFLYYQMGASSGGVIMGIIVVLMYGAQIILALANLGLFFAMSKIRPSRKQKKRQQEFRAQMHQAESKRKSYHHKCAICGRTELDDPELTFRFCSKCTGNKEYCQDHLFTHTHN